jgi:transcriptional regulator with XRE-family HTH domain
MVKRNDRPSLESVFLDAIRRSGLSLNELGRRAQVDPGQLSRYLRSERDLISPAIFRVMEALGIGLDIPKALGNAADPGTERDKRPTKSKASRRAKGHGSN